MSLFESQMNTNGQILETTGSQNEIKLQTSQYYDHTAADNKINSTDETQTESVSARTLRSSLSLSNPHILGIGTSNTAVINRTKEVFKNIKQDYEKLGISESDLFKLTRFYENSGIEKKHCYADFSKKMYAAHVEEGDFNEKYEQIAPGLAFAAAAKAIKEWRGDVKTITHVISCSCTGVLIPDINFLLIKEFGLKNTVERLSINMMGCSGGLSTLKAAKALALQNSNYRILMVSVEINSIHYRPSLDIDGMLACAIFGDGSAAMIIGCNPTENEKRIYEILQTGVDHIPDTEDLLNWILRKDGWIVRLSPLITATIDSKIVDIIQNFLKNSVPFPISLDDCDWLIHPGGKNILLKLQDTLNIPQEKNISAWNVLKDYGNMSSATVLFVMDDARKLVPKEEFSMSLAFGPGLTVEIVLLRKL